MFMTIKVYTTGTRIPAVRKSPTLLFLLIFLVVELLVFHE